MRWTIRLVRRQEGATAVEYSVMLAAVLLAVIAAIGTVGVASGGMWGNIRDQIVKFFSGG